MAAMYGADIEQLRSLATQFDRSADRLDADRMSVGNAIRISAWMGPVAVRFRAQWDSDHSRRLHEAALRLRDAASALRANAAQQERASAVESASGQPVSAMPDGSTVTVPNWLLPNITGRSEMLIDDLVDHIGRQLLSSDLAVTLLEMRGQPVPGLLAKILGPFGLVTEGYDIWNRLEDGDDFGAVRHLFSGGMSATAYIGSFAPASAAVSTLGPLALGVGAFTTLVDWTIPTTDEQQATTYAKGAEHLYGSQVDPDNLTPEQAQAVARRYELPWGPAYMISDTMDATADRIFPWNWAK